jgi:biopolymer transport protein TolQ
MLMTNPLFAAYADSDLIGKLIFISLLFLSIISWIVFIQKTRGSKGMRKECYAFKTIFERSKEHPLNTQIATFAKQKNFENPFLSLFVILKEQTLELINKNKITSSVDTAFLSTNDIDLIASYLSTSISSHLRKLEKNLFILSTIVTLGPFLGLLGTVWGILITFSELSSRSGQTNETILSGLAMALGTTIIGLLVAIPALIAYNYLKNHTKEFQTEMEDFATFMLATIEIQYRKL